MFLPILTFAAFTSGLSEADPPGVPHALVLQALRFKDRAVHGDSIGLARLCSKNVECFDITRLTPIEMQFGKNSFFAVELSKDERHFGYQIKKEVIHPQSLSKLHKKFALAFCKLIKDSSEFIDWVKVENDQLEYEDLIPFPGKGLAGKIASNAQWRVDFELQNGKWLATRFIEADR